VSCAIVILERSRSSPECCQQSYFVLGGCPSLIEVGDRGLKLPARSSCVFAVALFLVGRDWLMIGGLLCLCVWERGGGGGEVV
jgi:hypothetical protein